MIRRALAYLVGLGAVVVGFGLALRPGLVPNAWVTTGFVLGVWVVALVGAGLAVVSRLSEASDSRDALPTASERPPYPVPGDALAERTASAGPSERDEPVRNRVRERVRRTAVAVLRRRTDCSPAEAREHLEEGTWTDDADAASLFTGDESGYDHVETEFAGRVERAADAIVERFRRRGDANPAEGGDDR